MVKTPVVMKFYTRKKCHLCENAKKILEDLQSEFAFQIEEIDIDLDDELTERYGIMIPVVEIGGEEVQYGQIDEGTIRKRLQEKYLIK
jgi:glutaredoxin